MTLASRAAPNEQEQPVSVGRVAPIGPMLVQQTRSELVRLLRNPAFAAVTLAFPIVFFTFFGLPNLHQTQNGIGAGVFLLASFAAYGAINVALFSFGVGVAVERGQKQNVLMRATPLRPIVYLLGKVIAALLFAFLTLVALFVYARIVGGVRLGATVWADLMLRLLVGLLPFVALGFAVGNLAPPNAAAPIINLVYLPLSFASGLFQPLDSLPTVIQKIAPYTPTYRYAQLAWSAVGANTGSVGTSILWLLGYGAFFAALAVWAYGREQGRSFG